MENHFIDRMARDRALIEDYLKKACQVLLSEKSPDTVCGLVKNIARNGEETRVMTLRELTETPADMFVTVFIGNRETKRVGKWMVTPRGYRISGD